MTLTVKDLKNPKALEAFNNWNPQNPDDKTVDKFLATVGKEFIDTYDKSEDIKLSKEKIIELCGDVLDEMKKDEETPVNIPSTLTPELAKKIDEVVDKLEEEYSYPKVVHHQGFTSTFALYNNLKEAFKVGEKGSLSEVAFQLAQCETRMQMFDSLCTEKDQYAKLLKDNMDSIAFELATNQLIFDKLKIDPTALSEKNRADFINNKKIQAEIKAFLNGKKSITLAPEVVTATMAMHYKEVSKYGDELQKRYGAPTLRQKARSLDARLSKRYGEAWKIAKSIVSSAAAAAVFGPWGIAGLTAYRTFKKMREYNHEAKINGVGLIEHLKQHPLKIAEVSLSAGAAVFSAGVALGFEDAFFAKLGASSLRGFANESFAKNFREGKYKKTGLAFLGVSGGALVGAFLHSEHGHELMQGFYEKAGGFFQKLGIWPHKSADAELDAVSGPDKQVEPVAVKEPEPKPKPEPEPKVKRPVVHRSAPKPVSEPVATTQTSPKVEPQNYSLRERLIREPENMSSHVGSLMDDDVGRDIRYVSSAMDQGDSGIPGLSQDDAFKEMNNESTNRALLHGRDLTSNQMVNRMQRNDILQPSYYRDPQSWEVANPFAFEDTMMGYGRPHGPCPSEPPIFYNEVVVVHDAPVYDNVDYTDNTSAETMTQGDVTQDNPESPAQAEQVDKFDPNFVAVEEHVSIEDIVTSNLGETVCTQVLEGENGDTFTSDVLDLKGKLLETREGDISCDAAGNKVISYLAHKPTLEGDVLENPDDNCLGRTTIIEDRDTGHIINKEIEDRDGNITAQGQDFLYNTDGTPSSYTMHNLTDDTYDHHSFEYQDGKPSHECITKVSAQGELMSTEDIYNTTDENGNINYMHAMMDGNNQVEFRHRIYTNADGEHEIHSQRGIGSTEQVTKDNRLVWEKTSDEVGNATRTEYQYDESGKEIGRTVKTYKDNELIGITQTNGDKIQEFDGNGKLIKQTPPIEKPSVVHSATPKVTQEVTQESTPVPDETIEETSEKTEVEEVEKKTEEVKRKMQNRLPGKIMMGAGGAIAVGGVVTAAALANKKQKR